MRVDPFEQNRYSAGRRRGGVRWWVILLFGLYAAYYWFSNQQDAAFTGRRQLITSDVQQELTLGLQAYDEILAQSNVLPADAKVSQQVREIARRLIAVAPEVEKILAQARDSTPSTNWDAFEWDVNVIDSPQANAFCLPGGKMAVYTGILPVAQNEDALAAVMGHEIAHALLRHGAERMAQQRLMQIGSIAAGVAVGEMEPQQQRMVLAALGAGTQYGLMLPFSRDHETEADEVGLMLSAAACFDPAQSIGLWQRMGANSGGQSPPEFMSTHPSAGSRIERLNALQPAAKAIAEKFCR